jgi:hypothetical protein
VDEQHGPRASIDDGIRIDSGDPITQISDSASKSTKSSFIILNETDPSSISIDLIPLHVNDDPLITITEAGIKSRVND